MLTYSIATIEDAHKVIRRYGLDLADWGDGTAQGFATLLFDVGKVSGSRHIADLAGEYKRQCRAHAAQGRRFDLVLIEWTQGTVEALKDAAALRQRLSAVVRGIKCGLEGGTVWRTVAKLSTCPQEEQAATLNKALGIQPLVKMALEQLRPFLDEFYEWQDWPAYSPGQDELFDTMVRMDIERLDATLDEAPPWSGREAHMCDELVALMRLLADGQVASSLDAQSFLSGEVQQPHCAH